MTKRVPKIFVSIYYCIRFQKVFVLLVRITIAYY